VLSPGNVGAAYDFAHRYAEDPRVARVESIVTLDDSVTREQYQQLYSLPSPGLFGGPDVATALDSLTSESGDASMMRVFSKTPPVSDETKALVEEIREGKPGGDLETYLTGVTPDLEDTVERMYIDFPKVVIYVALTTYIALFWLFRSVLGHVPSSGVRESHPHGRFSLQLQGT